MEIIADRHVLASHGAPRGRGLAGWLASGVGGVGCSGAAGWVLHEPKEKTSMLKEQATQTITQTQHNTKQEKRNDQEHKKDRS